MTPPSTAQQDDTRLFGMFPLRWLKNPTVTLIIGLGLASGGWGAKAWFDGTGSPQHPVQVYDLDSKCEALREQILEVQSATSKTDYRTALVESRLDRIEAKLDRLIERRLASR